MKLTLEIYNNFVMFSDPYSQISVSNVPTLLVDTAQKGLKNVKGKVSLAPN